jgi:hypothetical protein
MCLCLCVCVYVVLGISQRKYSSLNLHLLLNHETYMNLYNTIKLPYLYHGRFAEISSFHHLRHACMFPTYVVSTPGLKRGRSPDPPRATTPVCVPVGGDPEDERYVGQAGHDASKAACMHPAGGGSCGAGPCHRDDGLPPQQNHGRSVPCFARCVAPS